MRTSVFRLSLAAAVTLAAIALGLPANAQEPSSQDPAATAPPQQQAPAATPDRPTQDRSTQDRPQNAPTTPQEPTAPSNSDPAASSQQNEPQMPAAGSDAQTQDAQAFTGRIVKEDGKVVLKDPVTKNSYQIDDVSKVKAYLGKQVKVTGKLDMNSNMIHVASIEPMP